MSDLSAGTTSVDPVNAGVSSASLSSDSPVPLWPEGVLAVVAGVTLLVIALRHRTFLQRKVNEAQRALEEFQRQGGLDDLTHVARQASEFLKGAGG
jgi:hypothetical protein